MTLSKAVVSSAALANSTVGAGGGAGTCQARPYDDCSTPVIKNKTIGLLSGATGGSCMTSAAKRRVLGDVLNTTTHRQLFNQAGLTPKTGQAAAPLQRLLGTNASKKLAQTETPMRAAIRGGERPTKTVKPSGQRSVKQLCHSSVDVALDDELSDYPPVETHHAAGADTFDDMFAFNEGNLTERAGKLSDLLHAGGRVKCLPTFGACNTSTHDMELELLTLTSEAGLIDTHEWTATARTVQRALHKKSRRDDKGAHAHELALHEVPDLDDHLFKIPDLF